MDVGHSERKKEKWNQQSEGTKNVRRASKIRTDHTMKSQICKKRPWHLKSLINLTYHETSEGRQKYVTENVWKEPGWYAGQHHLSIHDRDEKNNVRLQGRNMPQSSPREYKNDQRRRKCLITHAKRLVYSYAKRPNPTAIPNNKQNGQSQGPCLIKSKGDSYSIQNRENF